MVGVQMFVIPFSIIFCMFEIFHISIKNLRKEKPFLVYLQFPAYLSSLPFQNSWFEFSLLFYLPASNSSNTAIWILRQPLYRTALPKATNDVHVLSPRYTSAHLKSHQLLTMLPTYLNKIGSILVFPFPLFTHPT